MSEQIKINPTEKGSMPEKMSVVAAIELVIKLGYTSGDPIMWKLVKALRDGTISPAVLRHSDR